MTFCFPAAQRLLFLSRKIYPWVHGFKTYYRMSSWAKRRIFFRIKSPRQEVLKRLLPTSGSWDKCSSLGYLLHRQYSSRWADEKAAKRQAIRMATFCSPFESPTLTYDRFVAWKMYLVRAWGTRTHKFYLSYLLSVFATQNSPLKMTRSI